METKNVWTIAVLVTACVIGTVNANNLPTGIVQVTSGNSSQNASILQQQNVAWNDQTLAHVTAQNILTNSWLNGMLWGNVIPQYNAKQDNNLTPIFAWPLAYAMYQVKTTSIKDNNNSTTPVAMFALGKPFTVIKQDTTAQPKNGHDNQYYFDWNKTHQAKAQAWAIPGDIAIYPIGYHFDAVKVHNLGPTDCKTSSNTACKPGFAAQLIVPMSSSQQTPSGVMSVTVAHGSPFAQFFVRYPANTQNPELVLQFPKPVIWDAKANNTSINATTFVENNHLYAIYFAKQFATVARAADNVLTIKFTGQQENYGFGGFPFVIADLSFQGQSKPDIDASCSDSNSINNACDVARSVAPYAFNYITGTNFDWQVSGNKVISTFNVNTRSLLNEATVNGPTLLALYPHQYSLNGNTDVLNQSGTQFNSYPWIWNAPNNTHASITHATAYDTLHGSMPLIAGNSFTTTYTYLGTLPGPAPLPQSDNQGIMQLEAYATEWFRNNRATDFGIDQFKSSNQAGKQLYEDATMAALLEQLANNTYVKQTQHLNLTYQQDATQVAKATARGFDKYFGGTQSGPANTHFAYDSTLASLTANPNSSLLTQDLADHPDDYSYFVAAYTTLLYSGANVAISKYLPAIEMVQNDYAGECPIDNGQNAGCVSSAPQAFLRNWDAYAGHFWSSGKLYNLHGPNAVAIGADLNADAAMIAVGTYNHNQAMVNLGKYLYATEVAADETYWSDNAGAYHNLQGVQVLANGKVGNKQMRYTQMTQPSPGDFASQIGSGSIAYSNDQGNSDPFAEMATAIWPVGAASNFMGQTNVTNLTDTFSKADYFRNNIIGDNAWTYIKPNSYPQNWNPAPTQDNGGFPAYDTTNISPWFSVGADEYSPVVDEWLAATLNTNNALAELDFAAWDAERYQYVDRNGKPQLLPQLPLGDSVANAFDFIRGTEDFGQIDNTISTTDTPFYRVYQNHQNKHLTYVFYNATGAGSVKFSNSVAVPAHAGWNVCTTAGNASACMNYNATDYPMHLASTALTETQDQVQAGTAAQICWNTPAPKGSHYVASVHGLSTTHAINITNNAGKYCTQPIVYSTAQYPIGTRGVPYVAAAITAVNDKGLSAVPTTITLPQHYAGQFTMPAQLSVTAIKSSEASIAWQPATDTYTNAGAINYVVDVYSPGISKPISTIDAGTNSSDTLTNLTGNTPYFVEVYAKDSLGHQSTKPAVASFVTTASTITQPTGLNVPPAYLLGNSARIYWTASTDSYPNYGTISYYTTITMVSGTTYGPSSTTNVGIAWLGLNPGTTYTFSVYAQDSLNNKSSPSSIQFTTAEVTPPTDMLVTNVTAQGASVSWQAGTDTYPSSGSISYLVSLMDQSGNPVGNPIPTTANSINLTGLQASNNYTVSVVSIDQKYQAQGQPATSIPATYTFPTSPSTVTAPQNLAVDAISQTTATVNWNAPVDTFPNYGNFTYTLSLFDKTGQPVGQPIVTGNTTVQLSGLTAGQTYFIQVTAKDSLGNPSERPARAYFDTSSNGMGEFTPPSYIVATYQYNSANLTWRPSVDTYQGYGTIQYTVSLYLDEKSKTPVLTLPPTTDTQAQLSNLTPNTLYIVDITAKDSMSHQAQGFSKFKTLPVPPPQWPAGAYLNCVNKTGTWTCNWAPAYDPTGTGGGPISYTLIGNGGTEPGIPGSKACHGNTCSWPGPAFSNANFSIYAQDSAGVSSTLRGTP